MNLAGRRVEFLRDLSDNVPKGTRGTIVSELRRENTVEVDVKGMVTTVTAFTDEIALLADK